MDAIPPTIKPEFDQADYDELRKHYFERVVQHNVELPGGRVLRKQTSPPRIEQDSRGFRELRKTIKGLEKDIQGHKKEIREREETIVDKEKRIYDLKKKNQELEKFK